MRPHEVWSRPEGVMRHCPDIFFHTYPTHGSPQPMDYAPSMWRKWRCARVEYAYVLASLIGWDRWRCPAWLERMVRFFFRQKALPRPTRRKGCPLTTPAGCLEASHRVLLLEGWDTRAKGHCCAGDKVRRVYDIT